MEEESSMANPMVTLNGNIVTEIELRFTPSGKAVANFTVVTKDSKKGESGEWVDQDETFYRVTAWERLGEHLADSALAKGDPVIVFGTLRNRKYETKEGETRYSLEVTARDVAVSAARFPVRPERADRAKVPAALGGDPFESPIGGYAAGVAQRVIEESDAPPF